MLIDFPYLINYLDEENDNLVSGALNQVDVKNRKALFLENLKEILVNFPK